MNTVCLSGNDSITIGDPVTGGRVINDLGDGDAVKLTYNNDLTTVKSSKNGNVIYALNNTGFQVECELRLILGSADDKFMNSYLQDLKSDFSGQLLITASFTKRVGDGLGNFTSVVYQCTGGTFKKQPDVKTSAEGDAEQSIVVYHLLFGNGNRTIQ
jgi:hypothetical protein